MASSDVAESATSGAVPTGGLAHDACDYCGRAPSTDAELAEWGFGREGMRETHACPACVRKNLQLFETGY